MHTAPRYRRRATARDLLWFQNPHLWLSYPYLPVVRSGAK